MCCFPGWRRHSRRMIGLDILSATRRDERVIDSSYYMLIASLPHLPANFDVDYLPISRVRLAQRLKMLQPGDALVLEQLNDFLAWDRQPLDRTDAEVVARYEQLMATISNSLVRMLINHRIDVRTIVSGLRRRRNGQGPPPGVGQMVETIARNWQHPQFQLHGQHPWIVEFDRDLSAGDALAAQRVLYRVVWDRWTRLAEHYYFSFETVLLYLARWSIIERWVSQDQQAGQQKFDELIEETLGEYAHIDN